MCLDWVSIGLLSVEFVTFASMQCRSVVEFQLSTARFHLLRCTQKLLESIWGLNGQRLVTCCRLIHDTDSYKFYNAKSRIYLLGWRWCHMRWKVVTKLVNRASCLWMSHADNGASIAQTESNIFWNCNKLCGRPPQYAPAPASWPLSFWPWKWCLSHVWCVVGYLCANFSLPSSSSSSTLFAK